VSSADIRTVIDQVQATEVKDIVRELEASHPSWNVPERKVRKVLREKSLTRNGTQSVGADDVSLLSETSDASYFKRKSLKLRNSMRSSMRRLSSRRKSSKRDDVSLGSIAESKAIDDSVSPTSEAPAGLYTNRQMSSPVIDEVESVISELTDRSVMSSNMKSAGPPKHNNPLKKLINKSLFKDSKGEASSTAPHEQSPTSVAHPFFNNEDESDDKLLLDPQFPHTDEATVTKTKQNYEDCSLRSAESVEETVYYDCKMPHSISNVGNEGVLVKAAEIPKKMNESDPSIERTACTDGNEENSHHLSSEGENKEEIETVFPLAETGMKCSGGSSADYGAASSMIECNYLKDEAATTTEDREQEICENADVNETSEKCIASDSQKNDKMKSSGVFDEGVDNHYEECVLQESCEFKPNGTGKDVSGEEAELCVKVDITCEPQMKHRDVNMLTNDQKTTAVTANRTDKLDEVRVSQEEHTVIESGEKDAVKETAIISNESDVTLDTAGEGKGKLLDGSAALYKDDNDSKNSGDVCFGIGGLLKSLQVAQMYEDIETPDDLPGSAESSEDVLSSDDTKSPKLYEEKVNDPQTGKACFAIVYGCFP